LAPDAANPDVAAALRELLGNPKYAASAQAFAARYRSHPRDAALQTLIRRIESALEA
jgi:hypothetical protein